MQFDQYSKKLMEHFENPQNMGEIKNPSGVGMAGNPVCGDILRLTIKIGENKQGKEYIEDIKFKTLGCAAAVATSSMITDMAKGRTLDEAMRITKSDISDSLGGLPPIKQHCSNLADEALHKAIEDYKKKQ